VTQQFVLECPCDEAVAAVTQAFVNSGLRVMYSFDLHTAAKRITNVGRSRTPGAVQMIDWQAIQAIPTGCVCPRHGTDLCDCQMVVILVYGAADSPATVMAHGYDGRTWISLVDTPEQRPDPDLAATIVGLLSQAVTLQLYSQEVFTQA